MATREFFQKRKGSRKYATIQFPGKSVRVRSLLFEERAAIRKRWLDENGKPTRVDIDAAESALFVVLSIVDDQGNLEYTDSDEDLEIFIKGDSADMQLFDKVLSALNYNSAEDLAKNWQLEAVTTS